MRKSTLSGSAVAMVFAMVPLAPAAMAADTTPAASGVSARGNCHETHYYDGRYHRSRHLICEQHSAPQGDPVLGGSYGHSDNRNGNDNGQISAADRPSYAGTQPGDKPGASATGRHAPTPR